MVMHMSCQKCRKAIDTHREQLFFCVSCKAWQCGDCYSVNGKASDECRNCQGVKASATMPTPPVVAEVQTLPTPPPAIELPSPELPPPPSDVVADVAVDAKDVPPVTPGE